MAAMNSGWDGQTITTWKGNVLPKGRFTRGKRDDTPHRRGWMRGFKTIDVPAWAKKELERLDREAAEALVNQKETWVPADIWEVFDRAGFEQPHHLRPYVEELQQLPNKEVRTLLCTPPQHGKTTATLVALAWLLLVMPGKRHAYVTYNQSRSNEVCKEFQHLLRRLDVGFGCANGVVTRNDGGSVRFTSVDGTLTGQTLDGLAIVDDPVKNAVEARSPTVKGNTKSFFKQSLLTRKFGELSIVVVMTRWDYDDLAGYLQTQGWQCVNLTAICDSDNDPLGRELGQALWPKKHPLEELEEYREKNPREFAAMYQGDPTPEGLRLFQPETVWEGTWRPSQSLVTYGLDYAAGRKKGNDRSVCVRLVTDPTTGTTLLDKVVISQGNMRDFAAQVKEMQDRRPGGCWWATGGLEAYDVADMLRDRGVKRLETYPARISKRARSQDVADAWNSGKLVVPSNQDTQVQQAIEEVVNFTGDPKKHDDVVDALASAYKPIKERALQWSPITAKAQGPLNVNQDRRQLDPFLSSKAYEERLLAKHQGSQRGFGRVGR